MIDAALPGGCVVSVRRLRGGLNAHVHAVGIALGDGARTTVVLRRKAPEGHWRTPERAVAEFRTLAILHGAGVPAPRPLLLDVEGRYFDGPAILISHEGRPVVAPRDAPAWPAGLANALAKLHTITPGHFDLAFLPTHDIGAIRERAGRPLTGSLITDPLAQAVSAALTRRISAIASPHLCLVHRDFWPGNTVWRRGRLSAIIDWSTATISNPRLDIAQCRVDLAMMHGVDMAQSFLASYQERAIAPVRDGWFFDLLIGLSALEEFRRWLRGYQDISLTQLREDTIAVRLRHFLALALHAAAEGGDQAGGRSHGRC